MQPQCFRTNLLLSVNILCIKYGCLFILFFYNSLLHSRVDFDPGSGYSKICSAESSAVKCFCLHIVSYCWALGDCTASSKLAKMLRRLQQRFDCKYLSPVGCNAQVCQWFVLDLILYFAKFDLRLPSVSVSIPTLMYWWPMCCLFSSSLQVFQLIS